jgi:hypothetical protein
MPLFGLTELHKRTAHAPGLFRFLPAITILLVSPICSIQTNRFGLPSINWLPPDDYMDVGGQFFYAMRNNDAPLARRIAAQSTWKRIDQWISSHDLPRECPIDWSDPDNWFDRQDSGAVGGSSESSPNEAHVSQFYMCFEESYVFSMDIKLERIDRRWIVVDWDEPCESYSYDCP